MKPRRDQIRELLSGGSRRSLGRSGELPALIAAERRLSPILLEFLWDPDPIVCIRAADAAERISQIGPALLQPFKAELVGLLAEAVQKELQDPRHGTGRTGAADSVFRPAVIEKVRILA